MNLILYLVIQALNVVSLLLVAYIIISWLEWWQRANPRSAPNVNLRNPLVRWIESVAYSILHPIRRVIDPYQRSTQIDFSPFIVFIAIGLVQGWLRQLMR